MTSNGTSNGSTQRPKTGIKVVVVGAGFGGLGAAIECHRNGHDVEIYEQFDELKSLGDIISFGPNAGRIFHRWGIDLRAYGFNIHKYDTGEIVINQRTPEYDRTAPNFNGHRGELHAVVYEHATVELGIPIHLGNKIRTYFEEEGKAGIILENGEKGDVVLAADGVRSKARKSVLGYEDKPKSSGYAVWRSWFTNEDMLADPETAQFCNNGDTFNGWIGPDMHLLFSTIKNGADCCWVLTHPDEHDIDESWSFPGKLTEVLDALKDWDPMCSRIVSKTPESRLVDWKLVYRDPLPTWVSPGARILLLGDSAHPFLPTSAQGAAQAIEDGVTIATCLRLCGSKDNVPTARVREAQKTGESTRDMWHKTDWDKVKDDPTVIQFPRLAWIFEHDAERHAEEVYGEVVKQVTAAAS
ncbi:hypothetical protein PG997_008706 [Apiospora hydei]|uniref:FAD-binding domain-containing protein n=1 Tax=Apiospora hydei TaxID=1337664 RepID=A0ABR1WBS4_9PEZI